MVEDIRETYSCLGAIRARVVFDLLLPVISRLSDILYSFVIPLFVITLQVIECRQIIFVRIHGPWFRSPFLERPVCSHVQLSNLLQQRHSRNLFGDLKGWHANQFYRLTTNQVRSVTYFNPAFFAFVISLQIFKDAYK